MTTITLWLLISIGTTEYRHSSPSQVVERFATMESCEGVRLAMQYRKHGNPVLRCIQATVVKP